MYKLLSISGIDFKYIGNDKEAAYVLIEESSYKGESFERPQRRSKSLKDTRKIKGRTYTPDFIDPKERWVIEVKGRKMPEFNFRWDLFKALMNKRKNPPLLLMPITEDDMKETIQILKDKGYGRKD